ncbi:MAG: hypothetical protein ACI9OJ_001809 [Myxococcota bacterium]|jgi:hypothetical protein
MKTQYEIDGSAAWRQVDGHVFVITTDSRQHEVTGAVELFVWGQLALGPQDLKSLVDGVCSTFKVDKKTANFDLGSFMTHLAAAGIINEISK